MIDYRLAPESPFPYSLDDSWQAYKYLIENVEEKYGITPK
jgi:hormone-sensitive lipase